MSAGTLYVVATPIGNLEDITLRALRVLGEVARIACEDTRTTRKLLDRHGIRTRVLSCHEHNEARRAGEIAELLLGGADVALVSDAGTPGVSDPGARVVQAALAAGVRVVPLPGPSAALAALAASGIATHRFTVFGFSPRKGGERKAFLADVLAAPGAAVLFEAPHRIAATLTELAAAAPARAVSLSRELTKVHEEAIRGTLADVLAHVRSGEPRGEYTLVLAGAAPGAASGLEQAIVLARAELARGATPSAAARTSAAAAGVHRRDVYKALLAEHEEAEPEGTEPGEEGEPEEEDEPEGAERGEEDEDDEE